MDLQDHGLCQVLMDSARNSVCDGDRFEDLEHGFSALWMQCWSRNYAVE